MALINSLDYNTHPHMPFRAGLLMPENLSKLPQHSCTGFFCHKINPHNTLIGAHQWVVLSYRHHWTFLNSIKAFSVSTLPLWKQEIGRRQTGQRDIPLHKTFCSMITAGQKEEDKVGWEGYWCLRHGPVTSAVFQERGRGICLPVEISE